MVQPPGAKAPGPGGSQYFEKKGEVSELRQLLRTAAADRDQQKKRDAIKKVIAYMTLGIDVSPLFSEMVMASATNDLVQKKMVYLYLVNYAESNSELAILAVNTLLKDCRDDDPMIRGLALRSLCSLSLLNMVEYLEPAIKTALQDVNGYVRKTAVIGCVKLFHISPSAIAEGPIFETLHRLLSDGDTHVVANAIQVLNEILEPEGGLAPTREVVQPLLNRIAHFSEWGQCAIISLVSRYRVTEESEMFDIMNIFEGLLKQSSSAVILGVTKVFLDLTAGKDDLQRQVLMRLKAPLLTLMSTATPELAYTVLAHIQALAQRDPHAEIFGEEYKQFFCRYNDPSYIKTAKLEILTLLSLEGNAQPIVAELSEYVTDVDAEISRRSIRAIGDIAVRVAGSAESIVETLLGLLDLDIDYVSTEAVVVMKDLLRKYPQTFNRAAGAVERCMQVVTEPEGKCAMLWILGEYGDSIERAPYLIEPLIDSFSEEASGAVRLELLTAATKVFFRRAPEMQQMLGRLLQKAINETYHPDVRDRALMYYRLLRHSVDDASRVIDCRKDAVVSFQEEKDLEMQARIFEEFNTLSIIYRQTSSKFVPHKEGKYERPGANVSAPEPDIDDTLGRPPPPPDSFHAPPPEPADLLGGMDGGPPAPPPQQVTPSSGMGDLLGMGDDLLGFGDPGPSANTANFAPPPRAPVFALSPDANMEPQSFQARWGSLADVMTEQRQMRPGIEAQMTIQVVDEALKRIGIKVIASGKLPPPSQGFKYFIYAKQGSGPAPGSGSGDVWFLTELILTPGAMAQATVKAENAQFESKRQYLDNLWSTLQSFIC